MALFLFIVLFERRSPTDRDVKQVSTALVSEFRRDLITTVEIAEPNQPLIRMRRKGLFWMMESPAYYPATVEPWLQLIERATWFIRLSPDELETQGDDLSDFGLNPPRLKIVLHHGDGKTEIRLGNQIPIGNRIYAQVSGEEDVLITDELLFAALPKSADGWRDPALINYGSQAGPDGRFSIGRVEVRSPAQGFSVQPDLTQPNAKASHWRLVAPIDARADSVMMNSLLYALAPSWTVAEYVTDDPTADVEAYGLLDPKLEFAIMKGTNDLLSVQFGNSPTNRPDLVYARQVQFTNVVLTARSNISVLHLPYSYWRSKQLVSIDTNQVSEISGSYVFADDVFSYRLVSDTNHLWQMVEPETLPVDTDLVNEFFLFMNKVPIAAFEKDVVTDFGEYGLAKPARSFSFGFATNSTSTNRYPTLAFGTNANEQAFARRSDEISVYSIDLANFGVLPLAHWQWRDRNIWSFETNEVERVVIEQYGKRRELLRTPDNRWILGPGSNGILDLSFEEGVFQLSKLSADRWVAKGGENSAAQFGFTGPPHRISFEVNQDGRTVTNTITFGGLRDGVYPFASVVLDGGVTWYFDFPVIPYHNFVTRNFVLPAGE